MTNQDIDIRMFIALVRRWWWVLLLGVIIGTATAYVASKNIAPSYVATAKIFVQPGRTYQPSLGDIQASQQIASAYKDIITTRPVLEEVINKLSLPYTPQALIGKLRVTAPGSFIFITATDHSPDLAATLANTTAEVFIDRFRQQQLLEIARLQTSLADYGITQDPQVIAAQASMSTALTIAESAAPATKPSSPNTRLNVVLGLLIGIAVAGCTVYLLERLDDTIKSSEELKELTGLPTLGSVSRWPSSTLSPIPMVTDDGNGAALEESFKFLTASLEFSVATVSNFKSMLVTSASPSEGKTTASTNLAMTLAKQGKSVILLDADLRKPSLHRVFGCPNSLGLTNLFLGSSTLDEVMVPTAVPGLKVVPSGPLPPDATQLLLLPHTRQAIEALESRCDILIFDTPPLLAVADSLVIASLVDGAVVVVDTNRTSREAVVQAVESLRQTPVVILGAILNKIVPKGRGKYYYQHYYHYYHYYPASGDGARKRSQRSIGTRVLDMLLSGSSSRPTRRRRSTGSSSSTTNSNLPNEEAKDISANESPRQTDRR